MDSRNPPYKFVSIKPDTETLSYLMLVMSSYKFRYFRAEKIWRRLIFKTLNTSASFRRLCLLNNWPSPAWEEESVCREVYYRAKNFNSLWRNEDLNTSELNSGMFSCLKLTADSLFTGMVNGDIRQFYLHGSHPEVGRIFQASPAVLR